MSKYQIRNQIIYKYLTDRFQASDILSKGVG